MPPEATALVTWVATFEGTLLMSMVIPRAVMLQAVVLETFQPEVAKLGGMLKNNQHVHEGSSREAT